MSEGSKGHDTPGLKRREFLSVGALPVVAALGTVNLGSLDKMTSTRSAQNIIRVGLIGAGANVRRVQIPSFRRIPGCEVVAVANRSLESSRRVADEFNIPKAYANWEELLDDDSVDAVLIGTWPYMHSMLTLAALEKGKHVLTQARMANTAQQARDMLAASRRHPDLVCQLVPTSTSYRIDNLLKRMIADGYLGELLSVDMQRLQRGFADFGGPLEWRHDREFSGFNTLNIGSSYESMMRWFGRGNRIMAMTKIHVPYRLRSDGQADAVTVPDHVDILYELADGAQVHMKMSATTGLSPGSQFWLYGSEGTIYVDQGQNVFAGHRGDTELSEVPNPPEQQAVSRVEEEFINAIRGLEEVTMVPFESGAHYMEWTEAVYRSSQTGEAVFLPLL
jgi:predicted dehydrogenase